MQETFKFWICFFSGFGGVAGWIEWKSTRRFIKAQWSEKTLKTSPRNVLFKPALWLRSHLSFHEQYTNQVGGHKKFFISKTRWNGMICSRVCPFIIPRSTNEQYAGSRCAKISKTLVGSRCNAMQRSREPISFQAWMANWHSLVIMFGMNQYPARGGQLHLGMTRSLCCTFLAHIRPQWSFWCA